MVSMCPLRYFADASLQANRSTAPHISAMPVKRSFCACSCGVIARRVPLSLLRGAKGRSRMAPTAACSIRRPPAGNIEYRASGEGVVGRGAPGGERRNLLGFHEARAGNFREHEIDVLGRHLIEDRGPGGRRRDGIHRDVVTRELL